MIEYNKNNPLRVFSQIELDNEEWRDIEGYEGMYHIFRKLFVEKENENQQLELF